MNIPVLTNDTSPNGNDFLRVHSIVGQPTNGTVSILPDGTVTYTPEPGFHGDDEFMYRVCDSETNQCDEATVTVEVDPPPTSPVSAPAASKSVSNSRLIHPHF